MNRIILHMDMDAFYASVEQMDNPGIRGKPVIVGGSTNRGVVSAASYEARKFGVHSAMPVFQARRICPNGIFLPVRMERYKEISRAVMAVLAEFSPLVEQVSIDEAYMDISGTGRLFGPPEEVGRRLKQRIREAVRLGCSVGIAPLKFLAKIASDLDKPDGLRVISPDDVGDFLSALPIAKVPGVGQKTLPVLHGLGIYRLGQVSSFKEAFLARRLGAFGEHLLRLSRGIDHSEVIPFSEAKSVGSEETLPEDTLDRGLLKKQLLILSENVGRRLRRSGLKGKTVTLKLKQSDFKQVTRQVTLPEPTNSSNRIHAEGMRLLDSLDRSLKIRLIGIAISNLCPDRMPHDQQSLFGAPESQGRSWEDVERAMDDIHSRFGPDAIRRAGLMDGEGDRCGVSRPDK